MKREIGLSEMVSVSLVGTMAYLIAKFTKFPIFPMAPFLKLDFGEVPIVLIGALGGWKIGLLALGIKEMLSLFVSGSNVFGLLADFIVCGSFLILFHLLLRGKYDWSHIAVASLAGAVLRMAVAIPVNIVVLKLQFGTNMAGVLASLVYILPFNFIKCAADGLCVAYLLPRLEYPMSVMFRKKPR